jgi:GGDEF domain-containing protein
VLVLPGMKPEAVGDKILALSALASEVGRTVCSENIISASVGVASWPADGLTADELLAEADRRMYSHKNSLKLKRTIPRVAEDHTVVVQ